MEDGIIRAHIWDTAGQERFRAITRRYCTGVDGAIVAFDLTRPGNASPVIGPRTEALAVLFRDSEKGEFMAGRLERSERRQEIHCRTCWK